MMIDQSVKKLIDFLSWVIVIVGLIGLVLSVGSLIYWILWR